MSGHKAREPDAPKFVKKKKNRVSALTKRVDRGESKKCVPRLRERKDVPRLMFTRYSVHSDKPIIRKF